MEKCVKCNHEQDNKIKTSFLLGFRNFKCSKCNEHNTLPLTKKRRNLYFVLCILFALGFFNTLFQGKITLPGLLFILPLIALIKNRKIENTFFKKNHEN